MIKKLLKKCIMEIIKECNDGTNNIQTIQKGISQD